MTTPTGPGRRKARLIRDEPLAEDALVVLRAAAADRSRTLRNAIADATESGLTYVIVRTDGTREVLCGLSVFAQRSDHTVADTLRTFTWAPHYLRFTAGEIRAGGSSCSRQERTLITTTSRCCQVASNTTQDRRLRSCSRPWNGCWRLQDSPIPTPPTLRLENQRRRTNEAPSWNLDRHDRRPTRR
jgi:hypothetical protein